MTNEKFLFIPKIESGIVIDHIPAGLGTPILQIIGVQPELASIPITLGMNYKSNLLGKKDLIKIQIGELTPKFLQLLSLLAPGVTVKQIKNFKVDRKIVIESPEIITDLMKCPNPNCVTNSERHLKTFFHCVEKKPMKFACNFCERHFFVAELKPIQQPISNISVALPGAAS